MALFIIITIITIIIIIIIIIMMMMIIIIVLHVTIVNHAVTATRLYCYHYLSL